MFEPNLAFIDCMRGDGLTGESRVGGSVLPLPSKPDLLTRINSAAIGGWMIDPPGDRPGMIQADLDPLGRLIYLRANPWEVASEGPVAEPDWIHLFEAAGLDSRTLDAVEPWVEPIEPSTVDALDPFGVPVAFTIWFLVVLIVGGMLATSIWDVFMVVLMFLLLKLIVRKTWLAVTLQTLMILAIFAGDQGLWIGIPFGLLLLALIWTTLFRFGLFTFLVFYTVNGLLLQMPLTLNLSAW